MQKKIFNNYCGKRAYWEIFQQQRAHHKDAYFNLNYVPF